MSSHANNQRVIMIAGPTASGKSALAVALAEKLGGVVINADSMQVYRDLRIITARPTADEEARVPHRLYGQVDAAENYSVGRWCVDAGKTIAETRAQGQVALLVGGTGLYFEALTKGLAAVPPVSADVRETVRHRLSVHGPAALHAELARVDPVMAARLMPADRSRVARALEVMLETGRSLADWHQVGTTPVLDGSGAIKVFLVPDRTALRRQIATRFARMLATGALDEVRALAGRGLDSRLPAMKAHGVPWLIRHLAGKIPLSDAAEGGIRDTWRYTKRQATWFRNRMRDWHWVAPADAERLILGEFSRDSANSA